MGQRQKTHLCLGACRRLFACSFDLVEEANMKPLRLFVYNVDTDSCREVTVTPNNNWGGDG